MKRKSVFVLAAVLTLGLTACQTANGSDDTNHSFAQTEPGQAVEGSVQDSQDNEENTTESVDNAENTGKILIVYFAVAENSEVEDWLYGLGF